MADAKQPDNLIPLNLDRHTVETFLASTPTTNTQRRLGQSLTEALQAHDARATNNGVPTFGKHPPGYKIERACYLGQNRIWQAEGDLPVEEEGPPLGTAIQEHPDAKDVRLIMAAEIPINARLPALIGLPAFYGHRYGDSPLDFFRIEWQSPARYNNDDGCVFSFRVETPKEAKASPTIIVWIEMNIHMARIGEFPTEKTPSRVGIPRSELDRQVDRWFRDMGDMFAVTLDRLRALAAGF